MIVLASTSDLIRVITATTGSAIDAHTSWIDNATATITPGRTDTASITTNTTTTICGSPAGSTYRVLKSLSLFNTHASVSTLCTVEHYDGTTAETLFATILAPGESLVYSDGGGWQRFNNLGALAVSGKGGVNCDVQEFSASGRWTKPTDFTPKTVVVDLWAGGGGGGGGGAGSTAATRKGGGGGGGGAFKRYIFTADQLSAVVDVRIGKGGYGGWGVANAAGVVGIVGDPTVFGPNLAIVYGGGTGAAGANSATQVGGGGGGSNAAVGSAGGASGGLGGLPAQSTNAVGHGGLTGSVATTSNPAYFGGGGGGGHAAVPVAPAPGGTSLRGGGGGGAGGSISLTGPATVAGGAGGASGAWTTGGGGGAVGTDGAAPTAGTAGAAGSILKGGAGGGGGGTTITAATKGADGGDGGLRGGGGGGGGAGTDTGGSGGRGGDGYAIIYSY